MIQVGTTSTMLTAPYRVMSKSLKKHLQKRYQKCRPNQQPIVNSEIHVDKIKYR